MRLAAPVPPMRWASSASAMIQSGGSRQASRAMATSYFQNSLRLRLEPTNRGLAGR